MITSSAVTHGRPEVIKPTIMMSSLGTTVLLITLFLCESSAVRFYTRNNALCQTECAQKGYSYYWCWTGSYLWSWDYCSPQENVDRFGTACRSDHRCERRDSSYNWCYLDSANKWEWCGTQRNNFEIVSSTGYFCIDECAKRGYSYFWCNTDRSWGYCSPEEGKDYYNRRCDVGSYCDKSKGTSYYWCYVNGGSTWGYCSIKGESKDITTDGYYCATECQYYTSGGYFWCRKFNGGWNYCSPTNQIDSHGRVCDSQCSRAQGTSYYWCYYNSDSNQWDRCGVESLNNDYPRCSSSTGKRAPRQAPQQCERVRNVVDRGNNRITRWYMESNGRISRDSRPRRNTYTCTNRRAANSAIAQFNGVDRTNQGGTLVSRDGVRIDLQGRTTSGTRRFANIQIQVNRQRSNANDLTTIATALIETDQAGNLLFPIRYIRDALIRSLEDCRGRQCRLQRESAR